MFVATDAGEDRVIYSASDLAAAARCEYALLRSFDARLGWGPDVSGDDELLARTASLGDEHEQRHLAELRLESDVAIIGRPKYTVAGLTAAAEQARARAYAPYSGFPVGVAGLVDDGRVVTGCNVENASYGIGLCAECGMVSQLALTGGGRLVAVSCVDASGETIMPCGRCRQLIHEHGGDSCLLATPTGVLSMAEVLPQAFGPDDLEGVQP